MTDSLLSPVDTAIDAYRLGKMVIIVDDEDRENEGDLVLAADFVTPEAINFMVTHARGLVCLAMRGELLDRLQIPMMVPQAQNRSGFGTGFTLSVEAMQGVSTGISAEDRAHTIRTLINPDTTPSDIAMPGHIFPLRARDGGVLERRGQTEASVDISALAGLIPAGIICEVMREDGTMMRLGELSQFANEHDLHIISVEQLAQYRLAKGQGNKATAVVREEQPESLEPLITEIGRSKLPTAHGEFDVVVFRDQQGLEHSALIKGDRLQRTTTNNISALNGHDHAKPTASTDESSSISDAKADTDAYRGASKGSGAKIDTHSPLVRLHSECLTGDAFGSLRCDCGPQLHGAMQQINEAGEGAIVYLRQEGRGIGLGNKIRAYALQDQGFDTVDANHQLGFPADARTYDIAAAILTSLGITSVTLLSSNPAKRAALESFNISVNKRLPLVVDAQPHNESYLKTKADKMGHNYSKDEA